jgi:hypothetical protein
MSTNEETVWLIMSDIGAPGRCADLKHLSVDSGTKKNVIF